MRFVELTLSRVFKEPQVIHVNPDNVQLVWPSVGNPNESQVSFISGVCYDVAGSPAEVAKKLQGAHICEGEVVRFERDGTMSLGVIAQVCDDGTCGVSSPRSLLKDIAYIQNEKIHSLKDILYASRDRSASDIIHDLEAIMSLDIRDRMFIVCLVDSTVKAVS